MLEGELKITPYLKYSLWVLVAMIFIMVILGGATRLTGSGLSMVEWHPITGILPPLNQSEWLAEFLRYQRSPEFLKIHPNMTLSEFKSIFWLEYIHRIWGRSLSLVLFIPTFIVLAQPAFNKLRGNILLLWILGGSQGLLGWYMVKSGLLDNPVVSPYRLCAHLLLAFAIFAVAVMTASSLRSSNFAKGYSKNDLKQMYWKGYVALALILGTVVMGAFVAGLKAGLIYNTFPKMGEAWLPSELFFYTPFWVNFFENAATVQFTHRVLATITVVFLLYYSLTSLKKRIPPHLKQAFITLLILALFQYTLGILTLVLHVPTLVAVLHQAGALLIFGVLVLIMKSLKPIQNK